MKTAETLLPYLHARKDSKYFTITFNQRLRLLAENYCRPERPIKIRLHETTADCQYEISTMPFRTI